MRLFAFSVLLFFSGCQKSSAPIKPVDTPTFRGPTATEVFNLRSKCAELGEKILKNTAIGDALKKDQLSHYEPKTNRLLRSADCFERRSNQGRRAFSTVFI